MKTVILGTGSWGTALCQVLTDNTQEAVMWGVSREEIDDINLNHHNSRYFDNVLSEKIRAYDDIRIVSDADMILLAVPTAAIESVLRQASEHLTKPVTFPESPARLLPHFRHTIPHLPVLFSKAQQLQFH